MRPPIEMIDARLALLQEEVAQLRSRVERLEATRAEPRAVALEAALAPPGAAGSGAPAQTDLAAGAMSTVALVGRTLLELGGAYLLRAFTEAGTFAAPVGSALALAYSVVLLGLADREGRRGLTLGAAFHALAAMIIAFPAIAETTTRLHVLPPPLAAALTVAFGVGGLFVAWRHSLAAVGWMATLFAVATSFVLLSGTGAVEPALLALLCLALATEILAFDDRWLGPRWLGAVGADIGALLLVFLAVRPGGLPQNYQPFSPAFAVGAPLALAMLYVASIGLRTVVRGRPVRAFAALQGTAALVIGLSGAARVLEHNAASPLWVGAIALLLSVSTYAVAFAFAALHRDRTSHYYFYTTLGGLLLLAALGWLLDGAVLGAVQAGVALFAVVAGVRMKRATPLLHATILLVAASVLTGLFPAAWDGLAGAAAAPWRGVSAAAVFSLAVLLVTFVLATFARPEGPTRPLEICPQLALGVLSIAVVAGLLARLLGAVVAGAPGAEADAAFLAATRTGVLSFGTLALALASRHWRLHELRWLVPAVLAACALKILAEDFPHGRPLTQFFTFACYGIALLVTPRLLRRGGARAEPHAPARN